MTQDEVKAMFVYEPETGMLRRREDDAYPFGLSNGYIVFWLGRKKYYLHRLVFLYHHGQYP